MNKLLYIFFIILIIVILINYNHEYFSPTINSLNEVPEIHDGLIINKNFKYPSKNDILSINTKKICIKDDKTNEIECITREDLFNFLKLKDIRRSAVCIDDACINYNTAQLLNGSKPLRFKNSSKKPEFKDKCIGYDIFQGHTCREIPSGNCSNKDIYKDGWYRVGDQQHPFTFTIPKGITRNILVLPSPLDPDVDSFYKRNEQNPHKNPNLTNRVVQQQHEKHVIIGPGAWSWWQGGKEINEQWLHNGGYNAAYTKKIIDGKLKLKTYKKYIKNGVNGSIYYNVLIISVKKEIKRTGLKKFKDIGIAMGVAAAAGIAIAASAGTLTPFIIAAASVGAYGSVRLYKDGNGIYSVETIDHPDDFILRHEPDKGINNGIRKADRTLHIQRANVTASEAAAGGGGWGWEAHILLESPIPIKCNGQIRYGTNGIWGYNYKFHNLDSPGEYFCNDYRFGDPVRGHNKVCECKELPTKQSNNITDYMFPIQSLVPKTCENKNTSNFKISPGKLTSELTTDSYKNQINDDNTPQVENIVYYSKHH
jgi:hypothetical protein